MAIHFAGFAEPMSLAFFLIYVVVTVASGGFTVFLYQRNEVVMAKTAHPLISWPGQASFP